MISITLNSQAHWQVAQANTRPKPAKELSCQRIAIVTNDNARNANNV